MTGQTVVDSSDFLGPSGNATDKYRNRNPFARALLVRFLREVDTAILQVQPGSILDVGCGEGIVTERLAAVANAPTVGIDVGDDKLRREWARRTSDRVRFQAASAYALPFPDASFDCVCALEVLEHLERPDEALAEMARVARRALLLSVPNEPLWRAIHLLAARDVRDLGNTPGHINHWSARGFRHFVSDFGRVARLRHPFPWSVALVEPTRPSGNGGGPRRRAGTANTVLYFGTYEREYPRNAQVISCLRRASIQVVERHIAVWDGKEHKLRPDPWSAAKLALGEIRLLRPPTVDFDALIVGYPGHLDITAAKRAARGRPVVLNPLVSLEDTLVEDRQLLPPNSLRARVTHAIDRAAFRGADLVVADTSAHARYFVERFGLAAERVAVCFVGAEDDVFRPGPRTARPYEALFIGKLIPLHGIETILAAAELAPDITFRLVGSGQLAPLLRRLPGNVLWTPWVEYGGLPELYRSAGCALGIFGTSAKAARVIPNKVFQALATAAAVITADTPGARELLVHEHDALLVPPGDPEALAAAVRRLGEDETLREAIATRGRVTYETHASEDVLGRQWRSLLEALIGGVAAPGARATAR